MGLLDKLKFWTKPEEEFSDFGLGDEDLAAGGEGERPPGGEGAGDLGLGAGKPGADELGLRLGGEAKPGGPAAAPDLGLGIPEPGGGGFDMTKPAEGMLPAQQQPPQQPPAAQQPQPMAPSGMEYPPQQPMMQAQAPSAAQHGKDLEIISVKLDAIRVSVDTINQRISNLERHLTEQGKGW